MTVKALVVDDESQVSRWQADGLQTRNSKPSPRHFRRRASTVRVFDPAVSSPDVRLGDFDGIQLGTLAQSNRADVRIVIMSGFSDGVLERDVAEFGGGFCRNRSAPKSCSPQSVRSRVMQA